MSFFLGLFVLAACTSTRAGRAEWLLGLTAGLGLVTIVALFAYLQPGVLDSGHSDVPNAAGRLSYPIGYWNGAGALLAGATVLLCHAGAGGGWGGRAWRSLVTALVPLAGLGVWLADSRGAGIALLVGLGILVAASPHRAKQLVTVAVGGIGAAVLIIAADQFGNLTSGATDSAMRADGDVMSAICVAVVAVTGAAAWWSDDWRPRLQLSAAAEHRRSRPRAGWSGGRGCRGRPEQAPARVRDRSAGARRDSRRRRRAELEWAVAVLG